MADFTGRGRVCSRNSLRTKHKNVVDFHQYAVQQANKNYSVVAKLTALDQGCPAPLEFRSSPSGPYIRDEVMTFIWERLDKLMI